MDKDVPLDKDLAEKNAAEIAKLKDRLAGQQTALSKHLERLRASRGQQPSNGSSR